MSILNLAAVTPIRQTTGEITRFHFNGGAAPQFNIALTEPLVGGASYTFSGEVESISYGGVTGLCFGGGASDTLTTTGTFSLPITAEAGADGNSIFSMRGQNGTNAVVINPSLDLVA